MKAVLFDFGGTLDTDGIHWSEKYWDAYFSLRIPISKKEFEESYVETLSLCENAVHPDDSLFDTIKHQVMLQLRYLQETSILPAGFNISESGRRISELCYNEVQMNIDKSVGLLKGLKDKYLLGLVSNFHGNMKKVCEDFRLTDYFSVIIDSAVVGIRKPDPGIFSLAIDNLKTAPEETIVIGDSYDRDIVPSRNLGCITIWLKGKSWREYKDDSAADFVVSTITGIPKVIQEIESDRKYSFRSGSNAKK